MMDERPKPEVIHPTIWGINFPDGSEGQGEKYEPRPAVHDESMTIWDRIRAQYRRWRYR